MTITTTQGLINALCFGVTGWLTFKARCGLRAAYSEYYLYGPIIELAKIQGWHVEAQVPVQRPPAQGAPKTIDFLFSRGTEASRRSLAVEVKWVNKCEEQIKLSGDIAKLRLSKAKEKVLLLFGHRDALLDNKYEPAGVHQVFCRMDVVKEDPSGMSFVIEKSGSSRGALVVLYPTDATCWGVVAIRVMKNWP